MLASIDAISSARLTALATGAMVSGLGSAEAQEEASSTLRFSLASRRSRFRPQERSSTASSVVDGPPLLLCTALPRRTSRGGWSRRSSRQNYTVVAADLRGYGDSSKPAGRRESCELLEARHGARPGGSHAAFRIRPVSGRRARPRRAGRATAWRSTMRTRSRKAAVLRYHPHLLPVHARHDRVRSGVFHHWFNSPASGARAGKRSASRRGRRRSPERRHEIQIEYLRTRRATRQTFTRCARTTAQGHPSICSTTRPTWTRRSPARCSFSGASAAPWAGSMTSCRYLARARRECHRKGAAGRPQPAGGVTRASARRAEVSGVSCYLSLSPEPQRFSLI